MAPHELLEFEEDGIGRPKDLSVPTRVEVPQPDEEALRAFFSSTNVARRRIEEKLVVSVDDFDILIKEANDM